MAPELAALSTLNCRPSAPLLSVTELSQRLRALPGWEYEDNRITKTFRFADYYQTLAFVNAVAYIAQRLNHHPDLTVRYNHVVVSYSTHDARGVTLNDCICAARVEVLNA
ncbi:MAG TPA: 4a-hydroxytetrahydrobiopterin dehydratase [Casimicrobiaceae bacterium]|jgi:4a-hydroxytetrahydrobiopterin dehydratase|nr:4a-hydroxytetrahydrobiopterin dehydratase [Casimicrobiaceae bacterium]